MEGLQKLLRVIYASSVNPQSLIGGQNWPSLSNFADRFLSILVHRVFVEDPNSDRFLSGLYRAPYHCLVTWNPVPITQRSSSVSADDETSSRNLSPFLVPILGQRALRLFEIFTLTSISLLAHGTPMQDIIGQLSIQHLARIWIKQNLARSSANQCDLEFGPF